MINGTQLASLEATFQYLFDAILEENEGVLDKVSALKAITMSDQEYTDAQEKKILKENFLEDIAQIRKIYFHPTPQNRSTGSPYYGQDEGMAVWKEQGQLCREPLGLLGLTALSNSENKHSPVTREDIRAYIEDRCQREIRSLYQSQASHIPTASSSSQSASFPQFTPPSSEKLKREFESLLANRRNFEALAPLSQFLALSPSAEGFYERGRVLSILGRREEAIQDFNRAIKMNAAKPQAWVERAYTLQNLGDTTGALRDFIEALKRNPQHAFALCQRGVINYNLGKMEEAEADFKQSLLFRKDPTTYFKRGECRLLYKEDYKNAINDFTEALLLKPSPKLTADIQAMQKEATSQLDKHTAQENRRFYLAP